MRPLRFGFDPRPHTFGGQRDAGGVDNQRPDIMLVHPATGQVFTAPASAKAQIEAANATATRAARITRGRRPGTGRSV